MIERFFFIVKRRVRFFILLTDMPFRKYIKKKSNSWIGKCPIIYVQYN